ncbi:NF038122 family metalloprotease [Roseateles sp.]|uniref:NF038122 family metalloprotease n=1 Tax=Roseateles sp. TaxID=1971397 RepID=UPI0039370444
MSARLSKSLAALAVSAAMAPAAHALNFVFTNTGSTPMTAQQTAALQAAGNYWSSKLSDPVTIYFGVSFDALGSGVLGQASSLLYVKSYADVRNLLSADKTTAADATAVASLQAGNALSFWSTQGDGSARFDSDGSANNTGLLVSTANLKALGVKVNTAADAPDAHLSFSKDLPFSYSRVGGTPGGQYDFITVAEHEIGHALGFTSGVDGIDYCLDHASGCGLSGAANQFEDGEWFTTLDLFRYSAPGKLDLRVGGSPYFSINGGASAIESFSTGSAHGNGSQASHFGTSHLTLMRPTISAGTSYDATPADLLAFDAIGWDVATAVPEPTAMAMLLAGLGVIGLRTQRRVKA